MGLDRQTAGRRHHMDNSISISDSRAEEMLLAERKRADRVLSALIALHLPFALLLAQVYGEWTLAIVGGVVISLVTVIVCQLYAGTLLSRMVVAAAFMSYSALLIQESHGKLELHFHVFAALAFLLLYRDWRPIVFAAALIAVQHLGFELLQADHTGFYVFPTASTGLSGIGEVLLHAAFVVFEAAGSSTSPMRWSTRRARPRSCSPARRSSTP